ncbi:hypothetical protein BFW01_g4587 [Lasiodiplodia theobromae]|nr:hypothetical protein BFW01_g4587 [Lasiodiplodia theobromae]
MRTVLGITEDDRVARELHTLVIGTGNPTRREIQVYAANIRRLLVQAGNPPPEKVPPEVGVWADMYFSEKPMVEDYEHQVTNNLDTTNLIMAFRRLKQLQGVTIGKFPLRVGFQKPDLADFRDRHLNNCDSISMLEEFQNFYRPDSSGTVCEEKSNADRMVLVTLIALASCQTTLDKFCIYRDRLTDMVSINTFEELPEGLWKKLPVCFTRLKTLSLVICNAKSYDAVHCLETSLPEDWMDDKPSQALQRLLSMTPSLESFELAANSKTSFGPEFTQSLLHALPDGLKDIHLHNFVIHRSALLHFLQQRESTLSGVGLTDAHIMGGGWEMVFQHMLNCHLNTCKLGPLYTLCKDFYYLVTFSGHNPAFPVSKVDLTNFNVEVSDAMCLNGYNNFSSPFNRFSVRSVRGILFGNVYDNWSTNELLEYAAMCLEAPSWKDYDTALLRCITRWRGDGNQGYYGISKQMAIFAKKHCTEQCPDNDKSAMA